MKEDGIWRTVSGRRIFIKNGQSLSDAMRESKKFTQAYKISDNKINMSENFNKVIDPKVQAEVLAYTQHITEEYKKVLEYDDSISKKEVIWGTFVPDRDAIANAAYNLNPRFFSNYDDAMSQLQNAVDSGFNSLSDNPLHGIVAHEVGHNIQTGLYRQLTNDNIKSVKGEEKYIKGFLKKVDNQYIKEGHPKNGINNILSTYAAKNNGEKFAEAFKEYTTSSKPRAYAQIFGKLLQEEIGLIK